MGSDILNEVRVIAPCGVLGSGFPASSLEEALSRDPHYIACDAGSTDPGPFALGSGQPAFARIAVKRDLRLMLLGARRLEIPLLIGSAGTAGADVHLAWTFDILKEIAAEESLSFRTALIHAQQEPAYLKRRLAEGRIKPLKPAPPFDAETIDRSERIVGMMGKEPFQRALEAGADVVLAGRASDTAIFASFATLHGIPEGVAWHAAKILECGSAACVTNTGRRDCMMGHLREDHFEVTPMDPEMRVTPQSVAAHGLYENADPYLIRECSGTIDLAPASYEAVDERRVRVRGSAFIPAEVYTVKLEGAEKVGYQTIIVAGIRDPLIIRQIDPWLERLETVCRGKINEMYRGDLRDEDYRITVHVYGKNGVMGPLEPVKEIRSHELCLVCEYTAPTQEMANSIAAVCRHTMLHLSIPEWRGFITGVACLHNPPQIDRGAIFRFNVNHVVEPDDPYEMFPMEMVGVG